MPTNWRAKIEFLAAPEDIPDVSINRLNSLLEILADQFPADAPSNDFAVGNRQMVEILIKPIQLRLGC